MKIFNKESKRSNGVSENMNSIHNDDTMPEKKIVAKYQDMYDAHYGGFLNWLCRVLRVDKWGHYFHAEEYSSLSGISDYIKNKKNKE